jgi:prepilin-type N-terminal cleavage/methylation domain-containing protein
MQKFSLSKGFTLIELLVVIAILGILAAVVLIAINPAERIKESQDTQVRSDISTIASAVEACFTSVADGTYNQCATAAALKTAGFLKTIPQTTVTPLLKTTAPAGTEIKYYAPLAAKSARDKASCTGTTAYYVYDTTNGTSTTSCTVPTAP